MSDLTSENIFNTLNTQFSTIVNHAILGYLKVYQIESKFLSYVSEFENIDNVDNVEICLLIANANIIQYGKSYFLQQIMYNLIQMNILTNYINIFKPNNLEKQTGGGNELVQYIIKFMVIMLIINLTNTTSVALSMSPLTEVSTSINIAEGILTQSNDSKGKLIQRLNPLNDTAIMEFTKQYVLEPLIPEDSKNTVVNIYETNFIQNFKKSLSFFENTFNSDNTINSKFIEKLEGQVSYINELTGAANSALNDLCKSFTNVADDELPVTLYNLFNSKIDEKIPDLQEKQDKLIEAKISELEQNYPPKPNTFEMGNLFSWSSKKSSTPPPSNEILSTNDISNAIINVEQAIKEQIPLFIKEIDVKLVQEAAENVKDEIIKKTNEKLRVKNLQIYLQTICTIKQPEYVFNKSNGELYIQNPARSRFHLQSLAENVELYYDEVVEKGVPEDKLTKMQSLLEKSKLITRILTNYDLGLARTFDSKINNSQDINNFFNLIAKMWIDLKNDMIKGLSEFPITEMQNELDLQNKLNNINTKLEQQGQIHEAKIKEEEQKIKENKDLNDISLQNWKVTNEYFNTQVEGSLGFLKSSFIGVVNATTDIGSSTLDSANLLLSKGVGSVMTIVWAIVLGSTLLFIPPTLYLSIKSGYVSTLFKYGQSRLTSSNVTPQNNKPQRKSKWGETNLSKSIPGYTPSMQPSSMQNPSTWTPQPIRRFGTQQLDESQYLANLNKFGGKLMHKKKGKNKTRKNKKRKTQKLKVKNKNKRRYTKHNNRVQSKRR